MEAEFLEMMPHTVTWEPWLRQDFRGEDQYDAPKSYRCRIVGKGLALRSRQGDEDDTVIFDIYIGFRLENGLWVPISDDVFKVEDKVTLPPDLLWMDSTPVVFSVGRYSDETGQHHAKVQCGWMYHRQGQ